MPRSIQFRPSGFQSGFSSPAGVLDDITEMAVSERYRADRAALADAAEDTRLRAAELESELPNDPEGFDGAYTSYVEGVASKLPEHLRERFRDTAERPRRLAQIKIQDTVRNEQAQAQSARDERAITALLEDATLHAQGGDAESILGIQADLMDYMGDFTEEQRAAVLDEFDDIVSRGTILGSFERAADKDAYLAEFQDRTDLPIDQKTKLVNLMQQMQTNEQQTQKALMAEEIKLQELARAKRASDVEIAVDRGEAGYKEVEESFLAGDISGPKRTQLIGVLDSQVELEQDKAMAAAGLNIAMMGGQPMDPKNKVNQTVVQETLDTSLGPAQNWGEAERQVAAELISKSGIMPPDTQSFVRSYINSPNAEQAQSAADLVARVNEKSPYVLDSMSATDKSVAMMMHRNVSQGMDPEVALETARNTVFATPEQIQARDMDFSENFKDQTPDIIEEMDLPFWSVDPSPSTAMSASYEHLAKQHYMLTGDMEYAQTQAEKDMARIWGPSTVNGDRMIIKAPPEAFYGVDGVSDDWIRRDLVESYDENAMIVADAQTFREGDTPTYGVLLLTDNGVVPADTRWRPDFTLTPEYAEMQQDAIEAKQRSDMKRERARELKADPGERVIGGDILGLMSD